MLGEGLKESKDCGTCLASSTLSTSNFWNVFEQIVFFFFSVVTLKSDVTLQDEFELNVVEPISCQNVNAKGI